MRWNLKILCDIASTLQIPYHQADFLDYSVEDFAEIIAHLVFARWTRTDAIGLSPSNIKLLLLGTLRYIGRAWTLDDLNESNGISKSTNRLFLLAFIKYGSSVLYKKYVLEPAVNIPFSDREHLFLKNKSYKL